jgi:hypothetical protein
MAAAPLDHAVHRISRHDRGDVSEPLEQRTCGWAGALWRSVRAGCLRGLR